MVLITVFACEPALWCVINDSTCIGAERRANVQSFRFYCQRGTGDSYKSKNKKTLFSAHCNCYETKRGMSKKAHVRWFVNLKVALCLFVCLFVLYWYRFGVFLPLVCKLPDKLQSYFAAGWGFKNHWQISIFKRTALKKFVACSFSW